MKVSRRRFMLVVGATATSALLAACGAATPTPAPKPAEKPTATPPPVKAAEKPAEKPTAPPAATPAAQPAAAGKTGVAANVIAANWVIEEWRLKDWVAQYNQIGPDRVNLEQVPEGWEAKVMSMIRAGDVVWDGVGVMSTHRFKVQWAESGMIQAAEPYIVGSGVGGAKDLLGAMVPSVKQDVTYKGKVYGIPYSFEAIGLMWYREPLAAVGYADVPATWDETLDAAKKVRDKFQAEQITPIAWAPDMHTSIQGLIFTATNAPYTEAGLLDITGEAALKALRWMQALFKEGVTPPHGTDGYLELWQRMKLSMLLAQNSRGVWAQRVHGADKADTGKLPLPAKGAASAGSPFWSNTFVAFEKAKQPQAYTDFLIWLLGPNNTDVHRAIVESGKCPIINSVYSTLVEPNPVFRWMSLHRDMVAGSVPYPENTFWPIQNAKIMPWVGKLMEKDAALTPEEAMANALKDVKEEIAKQKVK